MIEEKLKELGIEIPAAPTPLASYIPAKRSGKLIFTSGQVPIIDGKIKYVGKVGDTISLEDGKNAARICVINALSAAKSVCESLNEIDEIIKLTVFVNCKEDFTQQPEIANGASDFLIELFGERGKHTRSAVGVNSLPRDSSVEIDMIVSVK